MPLAAPITARTKLQLSAGLLRRPDCCGGLIFLKFPGVFIEVEILDHQFLGEEIEAAILDHQFLG